MNNSNFILEADAYNMTHYKMYPENTSYIYSYFESRKGPEGECIVFYGLQAFILQYLQGVRVTDADIAEAEELCQALFKRPLFNKDGFKYIVDKCGGKLNLEIHALQEGTVIKRGNVLFTVVNTDPNLGWLTSFIGSHITHLWNSCTIATQSYNLYRDILDIYQYYGDNIISVRSAVHCFGFRGVSSLETAGSAGSAHLLSFSGTDTLPALKFIKTYYGPCDIAKIAFTVPAAEHSVMTSLGQDGEGDVTDRILDMYPSGIVSIVADSYDIYNFVDNIICTRLKDKILERDGVVVIRPDSGDPMTIIPEILLKLEKGFGSYTNSMKLKLLNNKVRIMWGDGLDRKKIVNIISHLITLGWAPSNVMYGMGAGLLQNANRDTFKFAYKCSSQFRDGKWHDVCKTPLHSDKQSKKGRFAVVLRNNELQTIQSKDLRVGELNYLVPVFRDGELLLHRTFEDIIDMMHG